MADIKLKLKKSDNTELELGRAFIDDLESETQSTPDAKGINYGVLANSGSAKIRDLNGNIKNDILNGTLPNSNVETNLYVNGKLMQSHITTDSDYSTDNMFSIQMTNTLAKWDTLQYNGRNLTYETSLYQILVDVLTTIRYNQVEIDNMLDYKENSIKVYLESIIIPYPYLLNGTIREAIDKICLIAQLSVIENDNGEIKFISARPRKVSTDNVLKLSPTQIVGQPQKDIILKNKYDGIKIFNNNIVEELNTSLYSSKTIYCCKDRVFIGNNEGVNDPQYNVIGVEGDVQYAFQFNYALKLSDLDMLFYRDLSTLELECNISYNNYIYKNRQYSSDEYPSTTKRIKLTYISREIEQGFAYSDAQNGYQPFVYNARIENDYLIIRGQIPYQRSLGSAVDTSKVYNANFVQSFTFNILKTTYNVVEEEYSSGSSQIELSTNELSQSVFFYDTIPQDYSNGLSTARISIFCTDVYDINGVKRKDWSQGQVIEVGDIIRVDKDNGGNSLWTYANGEPMLWKVVGRKFKMSGSPLIDLELQEIKQ